MPYLRFAAAVPRIKHTNARTTRSNGEQMLYTDTHELVESLWLSLLVSGKTTARLLRREILHYIYNALSRGNNLFFLIKEKIYLFV